MVPRSAFNPSISSSIAACVIMFAPIVVLHRARSSTASELGAEASMVSGLGSGGGRNRATSLAAAFAVTAASLSILKSCFSTCSSLVRLLLRFSQAWFSWSGHLRSLASSRATASFGSLFSTGVLSPNWRQNGLNFGGLGEAIRIRS